VSGVKERVLKLFLPPPSANMRASVQECNNAENGAEC